MFGRYSGVKKLVCLKFYIIFLIDGVFGVVIQLILEGFICLKYR